MKTYTQEQLMSRSYNENDLIIKYVRVLYSDSTNSLMYSKSISTEDDTLKLKEIRKVNDE